jgi:hypothetical protein
LISVLVGGEWSASSTGRFTPEERAPGTHRIGGWVGPRACLDDVEKRKFLTMPELELLLLYVQPVASRYTNCAIPALYNIEFLDIIHRLAFKNREIGNV